MPVSRHCTLAGPGIRGVPSDWSIYIIISNFFNPQDRLPKHMVIAQYKILSDVIYTTNTIDKKSFSTPDVDNIPSHLSAELHSNVAEVH